MQENNIVLENNKNNYIFDGRSGDQETVETRNIILYQNDPNPFDKKTVISFFTPESGIFKLLIYNSKKEITRILKNGHLNAGTHIFTWDGRSMDGRYAEAGRYNYSLVGKGFVSVRKLIYKTEKSNRMEKIINFIRIKKQASS